MVKPKLTLKQAKYVKLKAEGKPGVQAAMEAYDTVDYNTARQISVENLQKPTIQAAVQAEMVKQGIDIESVIRPIADGLKAVRYYGEEGGELADHSVRLKASAMAQKLMGIEQDSGGGNTYIFNKGDIVKKKYVKD